MTDKLNSVPRFPAGLKEAARPAWKLICAEMIASPQGLTRPQLSLVESLCAAIVRARALREAADEMDPRTREGMDLIKLVMTAEKHVSSLSAELRLTPKAKGSAGAAPTAGRPQGFKPGPQRETHQTGGAAVHWLKKARA